MKVKHKLGLLIGIIIFISIIGIMSIIATVPSKYRKVTIASAYMKNIIQTVTAEGVVEPIRKQVIDLDSGQKVLEVLAEEGQEVKKGDLILKLDSSDNQYKLSVEEINLQLAERELSKALKNENTDRKAAESSYKQAEIAYDIAKAELEASQNALYAYKLLFEKGAVSKKQYEESQKNVKSKEQALAMKAMEFDRAYQSYTDFELDKDEQIFKLKSNISLIQENIRNLKSKLDSDSMANIDGKIVKLEVEENQYPSSDNSQILIYDMSAFVVNVRLKQQEALYVKEGMKANIKVKGMDEKEYKGTVIDVDQVATGSSREGGQSRVDVKISIDDPDDRLKVGYNVEVKIDSSMKTNAVVVDFESIIQDKDGKKYIYCVEDNIARRRAVSTGIETSFEVEITEGIIPGDRYVVNPPPEMQKKNTMKIWGWRYESR